MSSYNIRYVFEAVDKVSGVMSKIDNNARKTQRTFNAFKQVGTVMTAAGVAGAASLFKLTKESARFESSFAGVRKTVDASESGFAKLRKGILDMSTELPASANEIAGVAEAAGQLGIKEKDILHFTKTMVMMGTATDMASDEAAMALARFANITQMPTKNVDRLGATVVALGNNLAATESEIVEMGLRLAGAGHQIGMTEAEIMSFAGALSSVGIQAEAGGSAFSRVMIEMANAVDMGGDKLEMFAKVAGMSAGDFQKAFKDDAAGAMITFIEGLGEMSESGENTFQVLDELGLSEIRVRDALLRAAGAGDLFRESLEIGSRAWEENTALTDEAAERYKTFESQLDLTKNKLSKVAIIVGDELRGVFADLLEKLQPVLDKVVELAEKFSELDQDTKTLIATTAALAATFLLLSGPVLLFIGFLPHLIQGFQSLKLVMNGVKLAVLALTSPWALIIAAALAAVVLLIVYWEPIKEFFVDLWESIKELGVSIWESLKEKWSEAVEFFVSVWEGVKEFFSLLWAGMLEAASMVWENLKEVWSETVSFFRELWEGVKEFFVNLWDTVVEASIEIWEGFKGAISDIWNGIKETAVTIWEGMKTAIVEIWNAIKENIFERLIGIATNVSEKFTEVKETIKTKISEAKEALVQKFVEMVTNATTKAQEILQNVRAKFTEVKTAIQDRITQAKDVLVSKFNEMYTNATAKAQSILQSVREKFTQVKTAVQEKITQAKEALVNKFSEMVSSTISKGAEIVRAAKDKFNEVKNGIRDKLTEAVRVVGEKIGEMPGKVREKASNMVSAGKDLIKGLINGIKSMKNAAIEAITGVVNGVVKKAKSLLKIKSPSRVMIEIGEFTGEGLAKGIDAMVGDIEKASVDMAIAATPDIPPVEMSYTTPDSYESAALSSAGGTINAQNKDDLLANAIDKLERKLDGLVVEMDGQTVGRIVRPHVNDGNALDSTVRRYFD